MLNYKKTSADRSGSLFAIVDERINKSCEQSLKAHGFEVIKMPENKNLGEAVCSHTDMLLFHNGKTFIASREYFSDNQEIFDTLKEAFPEYTFRLSDEEISEKYPHDAKFNALTIGNKIFLKEDTVSKEILSYAKENGFKIINVKQGYPRCTTLAVANDFAITSDRGMKKALLSEGFSVLDVCESEKISLPPYKFGFIGGAAGVFGDTVYFLGNLDAHPDAENIRKEISSRGMKSVSLDDSCDSLFDLGGIIFAEGGYTDR